MIDRVLSGAAETLDLRCAIWGQYTRPDATVGVLTAPLKYSGCASRFARTRCSLMNSRRARVSLSRFLVYNAIRLFDFQRPSSLGPTSSHVYLYLPIPSLRSRVQCQVLPYTNCIPDTRRGQGDFTDLRMGHHHLCPVLSRRPALRPILDFHPLCRWCCSRIHNRTVVCFTPRFSH